MRRVLVIVLLAGCFPQQQDCKFSGIDIGSDKPCDTSGYYFPPAPLNGYPCLHPTEAVITGGLSCRCDQGSAELLCKDTTGYWWCEPAPDLGVPDLADFGTDDLEPVDAGTD